jgi:uncharacterized protein (TIGR00297 family)
VSTSSEDRRQIIHIAMGAWALLLRWIPWEAAAGLAAVALLFNWLVLPRIGGRSLYRPADVARGFPAGILLYPFVVLLLILIFRTRLDVVAAVWGILAAGDGFATLAGRHLGRRRLPWNTEKTAEGTAAFVICGTLAGVLLWWWATGPMPHPPSPTFILWVTLAAALAAALVETIPVRLDDNISTAATAALIIWGASLADWNVWSAHHALVADRLVPALTLNAAAAAAGWAAGAVSLSGMAAGLIIGVILYAAGGPGAWLLLLLSFAAAVIASRSGYRRKLQLGIAEQRGGRRGAANAVANTGLAAFAAVLAVVTPFHREALLALVAALIAGSSDTVASEIGKAFGRRTFLIAGLRPVRPGTSGALSLEGTAAGIAAAALLAIVAVRAGLIAQTEFLLVVISVTAASLVESGLGATLEAPRVLNNDLLNFINTATAAGLALLLARGF